MEHKAYWFTDDDDMELASGGLNVTLRDYAKLGWLYLNLGQWKNAQGQIKQIIDKQWVIDSTSADALHLVGVKTIQHQLPLLVTVINGGCLLTLTTNLLLKVFITNISISTQTKS
jgi:hypothetical protein